MHPNSWQVRLYALFAPLCFQHCLFPPFLVYSEVEPHVDFVQSYGTIRPFTLNRGVPPSDTTKCTRPVVRRIQHRLSHLLYYRTSAVASAWHYRCQRCLLSPYVNHPMPPRERANGIYTVVCHRHLHIPQMIIRKNSDTVLHFRAQMPPL
jgi:hypothetical protein